MMEFLIRTRAGHGWPAVHRDRLADVLTPAGWDCPAVAGWDCPAVAGWGDHRLRYVME